MYFTTKIYQSIKGTVATAGTVGSILAICFGAVAASGGTIYIVGGSLCLANAIFNLIELGKVNIDIKKQLKELDNVIKSYTAQNMIQSNNNLTLMHQITRLKSSLEDSAKQVEYMDDIRRDLMKSKEITEQQLQKFRDENNVLKISIENNREQLQKLQALYEAEAKEKEILAANNAEFKEQLAQQAQIILQSKELIQNLAKFGDQYTNFAQTINTDLLATSDTLTDTSHVLSGLVEKLKNQTFEKLDVDNDGVITSDEFNDTITKL